MTADVPTSGLGPWWAPKPSESGSGDRSRWLWPEAHGGRLRLALLTAVTYAAGSSIARILIDESGLSAVFFIPAGLTVAFLIRTDRRIWWVVLLAAGLTEFAMNATVGYAPFSQMGFVIANLAEPLIGASIVVYWCGRLDLARLPHLVVFVLAAVVLAPAIGALIGSATAQAGGDGDFLPMFLQWWLGDALGVIVIGAGILVWGSSSDRRRVTSTLGLAIVTTTIVVTIIVIRTGLPLTFLPLIGIVLAGALFGLRATMVTSLALAVTYAFEIAFGSGILILGIPDENAILIIKTRLAVFTLAGLLVAAQAHEGQRAALIAAHAQHELELGRAKSTAFEVAANELQRALLPDSLVDHPNLKVAARYASAGELLVGGDWFDAFALPSGEIAITIGDVVGHGIEASAAMGRMRTAVSVLASDGRSPASLLTSLDAFAQGQGGTSFATSAFAIIDPRSGEVRHATAGHPPFLVLSTSGSTEFLKGGRSAPLGISAENPRGEAMTTLAPGDYLIGYSDGLIERRGEDINEGLARLERSCRDLVGRVPDEMCDLLIETMAEDRLARDDVVVLVLRYSPANGAGTASMPTTKSGRPVELGA